jgi:hypothetical protein
LTFSGINMSVPLSGAEVRRLVVLLGLGEALDLLLLGEQALELGIGLLDDRLGVAVGRRVDRLASAAVSDRRRAPPAETTLRGRGAPIVSPVAMAASRVALSSVVIL